METDQRTMQQTQLITSIDATMQEITEVQMRDDDRVRLGLACREARHALLCAARAAASRDDPNMVFADRCVRAATGLERWS